MFFRVLDCGGPRMKRTGVKAAPEEIAELRRRAREARDTPMILISPLGGVDLATRAWREVTVRCHELALAHGLPDIPGFYGMLEDGEFVRLEEPR